MSRLGIDFGTSNSAAGVMAGNRPFLIPLEEDRQTLPTAGRSGCWAATSCGGCSRPSNPQQPPPTARLRTP